MSHLRKGAKAGGMPWVLIGAAPIVNASVNIGDVTIDLTPLDTNMVAENDTIATDLTLPAAIIRGRIKNLGGEISADITINGEPLAPGDEYPIGAFYAGDKLYLPPQYVVVANGSLWSYYYEK